MVYTVLSPIHSILFPSTKTVQLQILRPNSITKFIQIQIGAYCEALHFTVCLTIVLQSCLLLCRNSTINQNQKKGLIP